MRMMAAIGGDYRRANVLPGLPTGEVSVTGGHPSDHREITAL
jgi:hypothetical protein